MSAPCPLLGFVVAIAGDDARRRALSAELAALLGAHGLAATPAGLGHIAVTRDGSQATDADRRLVLAWAAGHAAGDAISVSDVRDLS